MSELAGGPILDLWIPWTEMAGVLALTLFLFFRRVPRIVLGTLVGSIAHFVFWSWATFGTPPHISDYLYPPQVLLPCFALAIWAMYIKRFHAEVRV
jgi:lipopolysaccharide export LptBFGC system permease protein LptF